MEHLAYDKLREYVDMCEYSDENAELFEEMTEHIMECEDCARRYTKMLNACQVVDEFSLSEYAGYLSLEKTLHERYQVERLFANSKEIGLEKRLQEWLQKKQKGVENSMKVLLANTGTGKLSGMIKNTADRLSIMNNMRPLAYATVRGEENGATMSSVFASEDQTSKIVLDGNTMQLTINFEYKSSYANKPPLGILINMDKNIEPIAKFAVYNIKSFDIEFFTLQPGEYIFYLDE